MNVQPLKIPADENGPETEAEMHAEETRRAVAQKHPGDDAARHEKESSNAEEPQGVRQETPLK
jgi:hypothetical protein